MEQQEKIGGFTRFRKVLRIVLWIGGGLVALFLIILFLMRPHTPRIKGERSIASLEKIVLGGLEQWICIRGHDSSSPILLFLHGGPGMPMMYLSHTFQRPLEENFICVQWDQRGAGKSYNTDIPGETITIKQLLSDARELVSILSKRFSKKKVYLAGHSFGSYLGMLLVQRHPELFHTYVGIGQVVDEEKALEIQERFIRDEANKNGIRKALDDLESYGSRIHEKWLFKFRGELFKSTSFMPFIKAGILSPEYGFFDVPKVSKGSSFSSRHMKYNVIDGSLGDNIRRVKIPVYFFTGRRDYVTPYELIQQYFDSLEAPHKEIVWFDNSSHFPFFEEPERFAAEMKKIMSKPQRAPLLNKNI